MKSITILALWVLSLVFDTGGQLAFKAAATEDRTAKGLAHWQSMLCRPWLWLGIACFVVEFIAWLAFLTTVPLSEGVLFGMMGIVTVMIGGRILFHEHFTRLRVIGVTLIVAGVALVGLG